VLGNHDRRLGDIMPLVSQLQQLGLHDLGQCDHSILLPDGAKLWLVGNELPWFKRHLSNCPELDSGCSGGALAVRCRKPEGSRSAARQVISTLRPDSNRPACNGPGGRRAEDR